MGGEGSSLAQVASPPLTKKAPWGTPPYGGGIGVRGEVEKTHARIIFVIVNFAGNKMYF